MIVLITHTKRVERRIVNIKQQLHAMLESMHTILAHLYADGGISIVLGYLKICLNQQNQSLVLRKGWGILTTVNKYELSLGKLGLDRQEKVIIYSQKRHTVAKQNKAGIIRERWYYKYYARKKRLPLGKSIPLGKSMTNKNGHQIKSI